MKRTVWMLMALIMLVVVAPCAGATGITGNGETTYRALLIGVDGYQTNALNSSINDTGRMSDTLLAANEAGAFYQSPVIRYNLQADEIHAMLEEMQTWNIDADDVTTIYFAGHAFMSDKGTPSIVGKDSRSVTIAELQTQLDTLPGVKLIVLDCRYADSLLSQSGAAANEDAAQKALAAFNQAAVDVFKASPNATSYYVLTGATLVSSETAAQTGVGDPHGLFTYFLTQGCGYDYDEQRPTETLPADDNGNGAVSLSEIRTYIEEGIESLSRNVEAPLVVDMLTFPANTSYPLLARRATSEVLEVTLEQGDISVPVGRTRQLEAVTQPANASRHSIYWSTSDLSIATVDETGTVTGIRPGIIEVAATTSNGLTVSAPVEIRDIRLVDTMQFNVSRLALTPNSTVKLDLLVMPHDASEPIEWESEDESVATIDENGNVKMLATGDTVLRAVSESGAEATCAVQVVEKSLVVNTVQVNKKKLDIFVGESRKFATKIKPAVVADPMITYTSSDPLIAEVTADRVVSGISGGECTIYATASSGVSAEIKVTVKAPSVKLDKPAVALKVGGKATLKTQIRPANLSQAITWESSNPAVATVENGVITAVSEGDCAITANIQDGVSAICKVLVGGVPAKQVKVTPAKATMAVGEIKELNMQIKPANASALSITWGTSNDKVALVDNTGAVTAIGAGRAVITAKSMSGAKARALITVKGASASSVSLNETELSLVVGAEGFNKATLTAETQPLSAGEVAIKWASSNPKVATVNKNGEITARGVGKAVIRARTAGKGNANCNVTVLANQHANNKPIVGDEPILYTSAKRLGYKDGQLIVELYFFNQSNEAVTAPEAGTLYLTLADGTSYKVRDIAEGKNKLLAGKQADQTYKVKVAKGSELFGLNLRDAVAQIYAPGEEPLPMGVLPTQSNDDVADDFEDDIDGANFDDEEFPEDDDMDDMFDAEEV